MTAEFEIGTPQAQYKFNDPQPHSVVFFNTLGGQQTEVLRISREGITSNPDVPTNEAADAVIRALGGHLKGMVAAQDKEIRNQTIDEIARELEKFTFAFGADTVDSFVIFIKGLKDD